VKDKRFQNSNFDAVFGAPVKVYRLRRSLAEIIFIPAILFFLIPFGVITYIASEDVWAIPFCIGLPVLMFLTVVRQIFSTRRDELRIYEHGFTYRGGKNFQTCLWTEIEACRHRDLNNRELAQLEDGRFPLGAVEKKNGEVIDFDPDLPGTPEIITHFENYRATKKIKRTTEKKRKKDGSATIIPDDF
jgi:hypothetical protein